MPSTNRTSRITSKGQVTLPASWRKKTKANAVLIRDVRGVLEIHPLRETERGDLIIFNAERDNKGKGIKAKELLKILRSLN